MGKTQFRLYKGCWVKKSHPHLSEPIGRKKALVLLNGGGIFVRNIYNWDKPGPSLFWYVIKDYYGGIDELPTKVRNQVRRSQKVYEFKKVSPEEMTAKGWELFNKSRERFNDNSLIVSLEQWRQRCSGAGQDFWLGINRETDKAEVFAINQTYDDYCDYVSMGVNPVAPKSTYPMYGLILEMNRYYLEEQKLNYVMDGARSVTEHSNIQPFLEEKFKFRKAYCDLQVFYKPLFGMAVKMLFPFRRLIKHPKVVAILRQEAWARGIEK